MHLPFVGGYGRLALRFSGAGIKQSRAEIKDRYVAGRIHH